MKQNINRAVKIALFLATFPAVTGIVNAQPNTVRNPQVIIEEKQTYYITDPNPGTPDIIQVKTGNSSVATATKYRLDRVQVVGVAPGRTTVEFFDRATSILYVTPIWVEKSNSTGGGGTGYDPGLIQLPQIVMLKGHTENVMSPANAPHHISTVKSSNSGVATARTNTADTIQVYSSALGDTFISFADNGVTYQVHVWVRDQLPSQSGGGNSGGTNRPGGGTNGGGGGAPPSGGGSLPKPGSMDKCLVGKWVVDSTTYSRPTTGGSGAVFDIQANGNVSANYDRMSKIVFNDGSTYVWKGAATGHISAENGRFVADRVDRSNFTFDMLDSNGSSFLTNGWSGWSKTLGTVMPPERQGAINTYRCTANEVTILLTFNRSVTGFVLKRQRQ